LSGKKEAKIKKTGELKKKRKSKKPQ